MCVAWLGHGTNLMTLRLPTCLVALVILNNLIGVSSSGAGGISTEWISKT